VIIAGCVAQAENQEMLKREPYIDLVIGPQAYHKINETILNHIKKIKKLKKQNLMLFQNLNILIKLKIILEKFLHF
jgi:tRNA-2-methylthio-N6-dimethylallyladenosine synthase